MRIGLLTHEPFHPPSGGGSAEAVYLVRELVQRGHEVHVFCPQLEDREGVEAAHSIRVHEFRGWPMGRYARLRNLKYLAYPVALEKLVRARAASTSFDLLVSQHTISAVAAGRLRAPLKVPVVMNFLDFLTGFMETWPPLVMPRPVLSRLKRFEISLPSRYSADGVMTVSDPLAETFAESGYPWSRLKPIYYGYDAERFPPRETSPPPDAPPVVVMHGSFDQHHLGDIARDAVLDVTRQQPELIVRFIGRETASLKKFIERIRSENPHAKIESTGFVAYEHIADELAKASLGIIPYEESTGTHLAFVAKAVEYLGVGLPVVSTRLENLRRRFGDNSRIRFTDFDGAAFGAAILERLADPLLNDAAAARSTADLVREQLDWRTICRNAVDFLEKTAHDVR